MLPTRGLSVFNCQRPTHTWKIRLHVGDLLPVALINYWLTNGPAQYEHDGASSMLLRGNLMAPACNYYSELEFRNSCECLRSIEGIDRGFQLKRVVVVDSIRRIIPLDCRIEFYLRRNRNTATGDMGPANQGLTPATRITCCFLIRTRGCSLIHIKDRKVHGRSKESKIAICGVQLLDRKAVARHCARFPRRPFYSKIVGWINITPVF